MLYLIHVLEYLCLLFRYILTLEEYEESPETCSACTNNYLSCYMYIYQALGNQLQNCNIDYKNYKEGYCFSGYDLTPDQRQIKAICILVILKSHR